MNIQYKVEPYTVAKSSWPKTGRHILATYDHEIVVVYQAYKLSIAKWVVNNQTFIGCPDYSTDRMTWIKPNFLWMMYRSGWATKTSQERILAIAVRREGFEEILRLSKRHGKDKALEESSKCQSKYGSDDVRIQWDPDHDVHGNNLERRAIQLGLRGNALKTFLSEWVVAIHDITEFVHQQYQFVKDDNLNLLQVPAEKVYVISDSNLCKHLGLDQLDDTELKEQGNYVHGKDDG
ncbi:unnamed protein product [Orchesella dallaii]|uniref:DUF4291 domain-containing protein n=1 Tax=Orchesella dallaii TaxID=48710 RepID=A0ABP1RCX8_9HEXA